MSKTFAHYNLGGITFKMPVRFTSEVVTNHCVDEIENGFTEAEEAALWFERQHEIEMYEAERNFPHYYN